MFEKTAAAKNFNQTKFEATLVGALKKFNAKGFGYNEYRFLHYDGNVDDAVRLAAFTSAGAKRHIMTDINDFKAQDTYRRYVDALGNPAVTMEFLKSVIKFNSAGEAALIGLAREESERRAKPLNIAKECAVAEKQAARYAAQEQAFTNNIAEYGSYVANMLKTYDR